MIAPGIDHIALSVPDFDAQLDRLAGTFAMTVESRAGLFAVLSDPVTGLKLELSQSPDAEVHFRHFGFRADELDATHNGLVATGMQTSESPSRREYARMYTSFLSQSGCVDIQLCTYD